MSEVGDDRVTESDVAVLNRAMVERAASFTRIAGTVLVVAGALGIAAALWVIVREQQQIGGFSSGFESGTEDVSLLDRIDLISARFGALLLPVLVGGAGLALRLMADYVVGRSGGSLTGFDVGDEFPADDDDSAV